MTVTPDNESAVKVLLKANRYVVTDRNVNIEGNVELRAV